jgi:hypothetical protein
MSTSRARRRSDDPLRPVPVAPTGPPVGRGSRLGGHPMGPRGPAAARRRAGRAPQPASDGHRRDRVAHPRAAGVRVSRTEPGWPQLEDFPLRECLLIVLNEEWEHRGYAERDLAAPGGSPNVGRDLPVDLGISSEDGLRQQVELIGRQEIGFLDPTYEPPRGVAPPTIGEQQQQRRSGRTVGLARFCRWHHMTLRHPRARCRAASSLADADGHWRAMCARSSASGSWMSSPLTSTVTVLIVPVNRNGLV